MSNEAAGQFLDRVESDEQLQEELAKVIESAESGGEGADREGATQLGQKYGYDFTSDELWAEIKKRQEELQKTGELSDEELEAVAGGESVVLTATIAAGTAIATALIPKIKW